MNDLYLGWNPAVFPSAPLFKMTWKENDSSKRSGVANSVRRITSHTSPALVFAYNANSGVFNVLTDMAHKAFSPQTYQCNLCALTHSTFGMRKSWKEFLDTLEIPFEFLHADELKNRYRIREVPLPAVFKNDGQRLQLLIDADSINECRTIDELKQLVSDRLSKRRAAPTQWTVPIGRLKDL